MYWIINLGDGTYLGKKPYNMYQGMTVGGNVLANIEVWDVEALFNEPIISKVTAEKAAIWREKPDDKFMNNLHKWHPKAYAQRAETKVYQ